jgi:outer membrane receptor protein involved in Fe transport
MRHISALFAGSCLIALAGAGAASAQSTATPDSGQGGSANASNATAIQEVVVTATRQTSTVNKVPMSIAAETQKSLDAQGVKSAQDLTRIVPSLTLVNQTAGVATFAIRGIVATTGAATTGVYLDDTSVTKRNNPGVSQNNGAPAPILFDLDRVEVLKGPQGTLYGGSSQGGTIRYITPTPSLTRYSGLGRAEVATTEDGALSHELGLAVGGPIVQDKLGFRVSAVDRVTGGWIDVVSPYTGQVVKKDANGRDEQALRGSLRWAITDDFQATLAGYHSRYINYGGPDSSTDIYAPNGQIAPAGQTYTTPATCYNNSTRPAVSAAAPTAVNCATAPYTFKRAAQTYGPWTLGKDQSLAPYDGIVRAGQTRTDIGSLTLDYALKAIPVIGPVAVKSITSYIQDSTSGDGGESNDPGRLQTTLENPGKTSFPLFAPYPVYSGRFLSLNRRHGLEEELRFSSADPSQRLTWVAGLYYSNQNTHIQYHIAGNYDPVDLAFYGLTATQRYSIPNTTGNVSFLDAQLIDTELAGFGEANFAVTSKLKLTAGVRVSQVGLKFAQANWGQLSARADPSAPFAFVQGETKDTPVTPKFGVQYQLAPNNMLYFNAAEGFRAGGVNVPLNPQVCSAGLALFGLTVNDIPASYGPDTVWSYEAGGKFRLLDNRMQLNVAAFQIDWTQIQVTTSAQGCGQNWNQNGGTATSRGFDLQTEFRPTRNWTFNAQAGYTDAHYTQPVLGPKPTVAGVTQAVTFNKGDPLGVPMWQLAVGARYDRDILNLPSYLRVDYQFQGAYNTGSSLGTGNYVPFSRNVSENDQVNIRAGVTWKNWDLNAYANNLLDSREKIGNAGIGQTGCSTTAPNNQGCTTYSLFNPFVNQVYQKPRTIGVQANYRF